MIAKMGIASVTTKGSGGDYYEDLILDCDAHGAGTDRAQTDVVQRGLCPN